MTDPWGIDDGYWDVQGVWHETPPDTAAALRSAMGAGAGPDDGPSAGRPVWVVRAGAAEPLLGPCELVLEDGAEVRTDGSLPPDLPIGYHDLRPLDGVEPSPYFPSSRRWSTPLAVRIEDVPGADGDAAVENLAERARGLNAAPLLDRDAVWDLKRRALEHLWATFGPDMRFERWRADMGHDLETYARFCALAEHHGAGWPAWPAEHRHPARAGVASFATSHAERVAYWAWVQFLVDEQLRRAEEPLHLLTDLAIGVDPHGADAWAMQDLLANGVRVGAPPDEFNRAGQDWGLPPFVPHALRDAAYEPVASLWRAAMGRGGGLRIDHVMGLFRLYWIPPGGGPADGAYVRYRGDEMLAVLAIESVRSGAVVVGEDLGTVEDEVRHALGEAGVLSYRLAWFQGETPEHYPAQALAAG